MQAGNPLSLESLLYVSVTKLRDQYYVIRISGDPDDPMRSSRIDIEWARQQIQTYGRENPWVMIYILGKFPPASVNSLIGPDDCDLATKRQPREDQFSWAPRILGVDCARFGDDATCLVERQGLVCSPFTVLRNQRTEEIGGRILRARQERGIAATFIDSAMGGGVVDYCRLLGHELVEVAFSGKAKDPRYFNRRTEMAFTACDFIKSGAMIPNDPEFISELCAHTYTFKGDQMLLEPKELVKLKLGRSPDRFDAYILTHAEHVAVDDSLENFFKYPGLRDAGNVGHAITDRREE
jgi:phage terminase large subunit